MRCLPHVLIGITLLCTVPRPARGQGAGTDRPDTTITAAIRAVVLDTLIDRIERYYVFPTVAKDIGRALRRRAARHEYDALASANAYADSLTAHVQAVSHDKHMRVRYNPDFLPFGMGSDDEKPSPEELAAMRQSWRLRNYGFERVQRLAGNIGYLDLRNFCTPQVGGGETAVAAMNFLGNCDALIVDLRRNGGGDPDMLDLLVSYLYEPGERVHLNDFYMREHDRTEQYFTLSHAPGPHLAGKDVYVLTSRRTFSCAEEMAYDLQSLKRATLVGETTGGGANPGGMQRLDGHFMVFVPTGRAVNPITKSNWEGVGVKPDVAVAAENALMTAHVAALKKLLEKATGDEDRKRLTRAIEEAAKTPPDPIEMPGMARSAGR
jgi:retinol-binding protein 3